MRSDIAMDVGKSINPMVDIGQIEGAFVQGMGMTTIEELTWGDKHHEWFGLGIFLKVNFSLTTFVPSNKYVNRFRPGHFYSNGPGNYKIPSMDDIPRNMNVKLMSNCNSPAVHSSR